MNYTEKKRDAYIDGEDMIEEEFMQLALNKYVMRKQSNDWSIPFAEQQQLNSLTSEFKKLKEVKTTHHIPKGTSNFKEKGKADLTVSNISVIPADLFP